MPWTDVAIHFLFDQFGSLTMFCVLFGCQKAAHRHGRVARIFTEHRGMRIALNCALGLIASIVLVKVVG